ncbi:hypothetical protein DL98DRAFT_536023 [Cadophora sp. DSE1049]|nr:hypothetical protein DL98DRAFT_536023 [Cadophora sp. DSE1049]
MKIVNTTGSTPNRAKLAVPSLILSGTLAVAYRRIYIYCICSLIKDPSGNCSFDNPANKKYIHYVKKKEKYHLINAVIRVTNSQFLALATPAPTPTLTPTTPSSIGKELAALGPLVVKPVEGPY